MLNIQHLMLSNLISLTTSENTMNMNMKHKLHFKGGSIYIKETQNRDAMSIELLITTTPTLKENNNTVTVDQKNVLLNNMVQIKSLMPSHCFKFLICCICGYPVLVISSYFIIYRLF